MTDPLPDGLVPSGSSPVFTQDTLPDALQAEHTLGAGHWAVLNVFEGSLRFVNLETGEERVIAAPDHVTIRPGLPHRVAIEGPLRCRIDFFRERPPGSSPVSDERELCEIQVLMTQLRCNADVRQAVRSCLEDPQSLEPESQITRMLELVPPGMSDTTLALRCSLIKDAIRVCRATSDGSAREQTRNPPAGRNASPG